MSDHEYDGIKELDNPMPEWWVIVFLGTIIFAFLYWIHYEIAGGQSIEEELKEDMSHIEALQKKGSSGPESEDDLLMLLSSSEAIEGGKQVYDLRCASCHGPELQGLIGPNLTDHFWLHGEGKMVDIVDVIKKGVLEKGMPPWDGILNAGEVRAVAAFIKKHKDSNPPNPKAPQGNEFVD